MNRNSSNNHIHHHLHSHHGRPLSPIHMIRNITRPLSPPLINRQPSFMNEGTTGTTTTTSTGQIPEMLRAVSMDSLTGRMLRSTSEGLMMRGTSEMKMDTR
jgi:hypothetical protein